MSIVKFVPCHFRRWGIPWASQLCHEYLHFCLPWFCYLTKWNLEVVNGIRIFTAIHEEYQEFLSLMCKTLSSPSPLLKEAIPLWFMHHPDQIKIIWSERVEDKTMQLIFLTPAAFCWRNYDADENVMTNISVHWQDSCNAKDTSIKTILYIYLCLFIYIYALSLTRNPSTCILCNRLCIFDDVYCSICLAFSHPLHDVSSGLMVMLFQDLPHKLNVAIAECLFRSLGIPISVCIVRTQMESATNTVFGEGWTHNKINTLWSLCPSAYKKTQCYLVCSKHSGYSMLEC